MMKMLSSIFGGGAIKSIEAIASEWIETDTEKAEAKTVLIKALDPNGIMRRQLSRKVGMLYSWYIFTMLFLIAVEFFCAVFGVGIDQEAVADATSKAVTLFIPITSLFGVIVTASFGVNAYNVKTGK